MASITSLFTKEAMNLYNNLNEDNKGYIIDKINQMFSSLDDVNELNEFVIFNIKYCM